MNESLQPKLTSSANSSSHDSWLIAAVALTFIHAGLGLYWLLGTGHFLYDQSFFFHNSVLFSEGAKFPVIGPFISGSNPQAYFPGGGVYILYGIMHFIFPSHHSLIGGPIILTSLAMLTWISRCLKSSIPSRFIFISCLIFSLNYWHFRFMETIWNVNHFQYLSIFLLALTWPRIFSKTAMSRLEIFVAGVLTALLIQVHFGGALLAACLGLAILWQTWRQLRFAQVAVFLMGIFIPYMPYFYVTIFIEPSYLSSLSQCCAAGSAGADVHSLRKSLQVVLFYPANIR